METGRRTTDDRRQTTDDGLRTTDVTYRRHPDVVFRDIAGVFILVPIARRADEVDSFYTLNGTGALVWKHLARPRSVRSLSMAVARHFGIPPQVAQRDVAAFLDVMRSAGCIVADAATAARPTPRRPTRRARP